MKRVAALLIASVILGADAGYVPPKGFIPDEATAVRVAEALLVPVYGAQNIANERPLTAKLEGDVWIVTGSVPPGRVGGAATVKIAKRDGRVLYMMHGK